MWTSLQSMIPSFDPTTLTGAMELAVLFLMIGQIASTLMGRSFRFLIEHDTEGRIDRLTA